MHGKARNDKPNEWVEESIMDGIIIRDPKICSGEPVFVGTRVTLRTILATLAEGATVGDILSDFPSLTEEHLWAAIRFAAASAEEDLPVQQIPVLS